MWDEDIRRTSKLLFYTYYHGDMGMATNGHDKRSYRLRACTRHQRLQEKHKTGQREKGGLSVTAPPSFLSPANPPTLAGAVFRCGRAHAPKSIIPMADSERSLRLMALLTLFITTILYFTFVWVPAGPSPPPPPQPTPHLLGPTHCSSVLWLDRLPLTH